MSKKLTIEEVNKFIEENSDCKLLSTHYTDCYDKLKFLCHCGNEFEATFSQFKFKNKRQCNKHTHSQNVSFEEVKWFIEIISNSGCKLLSTKYINSNEEISLKCKCGNEFKTSYSKFKHRNKRQCNVCGIEQRAALKRLSFKEVKHFIEIESKSNCKLLSVEYINYFKPLIFQCSCGKTFKKTFADFKNRNLRKCNKCSKSLSNIESYAIEFLKKQNINFITQYKFKNCKYKKLLLFDFYLPDANLCIEIDGEQHYKPVTHFGGIKDYEIRKKRDEIKDNYCKSHNIKLIRIPYYEFENIEKILKNAGIIK